MHLKRYRGGKSREIRVNATARELDTNRTMVYPVIDKTISFGVEKALEDSPSRGRNWGIGDEARSFS